MKEQTQSAEKVHILAQQIGLTVPETCLPGMLSNMALLQGYVSLILSLPLSDVCAPAPEYTP